MKQLYFSYFVFFFLLTQNCLAQPFTSGFNFNLPADDSISQRFLPNFNSGPITDFVDVNNQGHFEAGNEEMRFWGVNFTTGACFPLKEKASFITARLNKMGINLVRFHHMDNPWTNQNGTLLDRSLPHTRSLHPTSLDRMFYLLAHMKRNGVYANMNLHVSRTFTEADGVPGADSISNYGKGVTYFDPHLIALQKEYASQLLGAVNPYTGLSLANDQVMAMLEITNENTLYGMWRSSQLQPISHGGVLITRHSKMLDSLWQNFLIDKYASESVLQNAWDDTSTSGVPENLVIDGDFESGDPNSEWTLEMHNGALASIQSDANEVFEGDYSCMVNVQNVTGTGWHLQFKQTGGTLRKDSVYTFEFWAKGDRQREISASLMRDNAPYTYYGGQTFELDTIWKKLTFSITAPEDNINALRITFGFNNEIGSVWFDNVRVGRQKFAGLLPTESLLNQDIRRNPFSERYSFSHKRIADLAAFYISIQRKYYDEMYQFLRDSLGVKVPITGTNALSGLADVLSMQNLDYIDDHAYWNHPHFPNAAWSSWDWSIANTSMLQAQNLGNIPGLFGGLALSGKPYTVSEYNHPFPNIYRTEMMPIMASYLSFHDADAIMFFQYEDDHEQWEEDQVSGFFSINRDPALMSLSPIFAHMYRKRMLQESAPRILNYSKGYIYRGAIDESPNRWHKAFGYPSGFAVQQSARIGSFDSTGIYFSNNVPVDPAGPQYITNTNEIISDINKGLFIIESPKIASISGFLADSASISAGPMTLHNADGFGVVTWMSLDESPLITATESVLTISSRAQNSNMIWDGNQTVHNNWGNSPTEIQALNISLELELLADSLRIYPLNERGEESGHFTIFPRSNGKFDLNIDQTLYSSTWFGVESFLQTVSIQTPITRNFSIGPVPTSDYLNIQSSGVALRTVYKIYNTSGQEVKNGVLIDSERVSLIGLPKGIYFMSLKNSEFEAHFKFIKQ